MTKENGDWDENYCCCERLFQRELRRKAKVMRIWCSSHRAHAFIVLFSVFAHYAVFYYYIGANFKYRASAYVNNVLAAKNLFVVLVMFGYRYDLQHPRRSR